MDEINYSIIIPHKNIPKLLQRCLNSIPRRKDIQIIVVDDDSNSDKVDFEHFPGVGEECVEVYFTREGKGAGYARNVGLKHAKGKWLLFADADDFFSKYLISSLDKYYNSNYDIVFFNTYCINSTTLKTDCSPHHHGNSLRSIILQNNIDSTNSENNLRYKFGPPWCKLINHNLIIKHKILFDEVLKCNDTMFSLKIGTYAKNIIIDTTPIYYNTYRNDSITYKTEDYSIIRDKLRTFYKYDIFYENYVQLPNKDHSYRLLAELKYYIVNFKINSLYKSFLFLYNERLLNEILISAVPYIFSRGFKKFKMFHKNNTK